MKMWIILFFCAVCCAQPNTTEPEFIVHNYSESVFEGPELQVVTFNVLHGFGDITNDLTLPARLEILASTVVQLQPDVLLLQEVSVTPNQHGNVAIKLAERINQKLPTLSYNYLYARANGSAKYIGFEEGAAILSRHKINHPKVHFYKHNSTTLPEFRIALYCNISGKNGNIGCISTHLTNREDKVNGELARHLQAKELVQEIIPLYANSPLLMGGDFNDSPTSETIQIMLRAKSLDVFPQKNPKSSGFTSFGDSFDLFDPSALAESRIDYLFVHDQAAKIQHCSLFLNEAQKVEDSKGTYFLWASDHIGVKAIIVPRGY